MFEHRLLWGVGRLDPGLTKTNKNKSLMGGVREGVHYGGYALVPARALAILENKHIQVGLKANVSNDRDTK